MTSLGTVCTVPMIFLENIYIINFISHQMKQWAWKWNVLVCKIPIFILMQSSNTILNNLLRRKSTKAKVLRTTQMSRWASDVCKSLRTVTGTSSHPIVSMWSWVTTSENWVRVGIRLLGMNYEAVGNIKFETAFKAWNSPWDREKCRVLYEPMPFFILFVIIA